MVSTDEFYGFSYLNPREFISAFIDYTGNSNYDSTEWITVEPGLDVLTHS